MGEAVSISVILPVYNTAEFLPFTLRNIVAEQFNNTGDSWELIIVDDGSSDSSAVIAREWVNRFPSNISFFRTANRGVSSARNLGLSHARGCYVYFIDSDDILLAGTLPQLLSHAAGADLIKFIFREISTPEYFRLTLDVPPANLSDEDFSRHSASEFIRITNGLTGPPSHHGAWATIYRRQFLLDNSLSFDPGLAVGEDIILTWSAMQRNPSILFADRALYLYHQRSGSALHALSPERLRVKAAAYIPYLIRLQQLAPVHPEAFKSNIRYALNRALSDMIFGREPLRQIARVMTRLRRSGIDIHPGRPRFSRSERRDASTADKIRRWITAYILAPAISLLRSGKVKKVS